MHIHLFIILTYVIIGLGLYIGPYCMNLAIQKAKKYGVGFVAVQNSTHYGIAGYYSTMASKEVRTNMPLCIVILLNTSI
jgi:hypothetical protein